MTNKTFSIIIITIILLAALGFYLMKDNPLASYLIAGALFLFSIGLVEQNIKK